MQLWGFVFVVTWLKVIATFAFMWSDGASYLLPVSFSTLCPLLACFQLHQHSHVVFSCHHAYWPASAWFIIYDWLPNLTSYLKFCAHVSQMHFISDLVLIVFTWLLSFGFRNTCSSKFFSLIETALLTSATTHPFLSIATCLASSLSRPPTFAFSDVACCAFHLIQLSPSPITFQVLQTLSVLCCNFSVTTPCGFLFPQLFCTTAYLCFATPLSPNLIVLSLLLALWVNCSPLSLLYPLGAWVLLPNPFFDCLSLFNSTAFLVSFLFADSWLLYTLDILGHCRFLWFLSLQVL